MKKTFLLKTILLALLCSFIIGGITRPLVTNAKDTLKSVEHIKASSDDQSITLSWKKVSKAKKYNIYMEKKGWTDWKKTSKDKFKEYKKKDNYKTKKKDGKYYYKKYTKDFFKIKTTKNLKITIHKLDSYKKYKFKISACKGEKESKLSKTVTVKTHKPYKPYKSENADTFSKVNNDNEENYGEIDYNPSSSNNSNSSNNNTTNNNNNNNNNNSNNNSDNDENKAGTYFFGVNSVTVSNDTYNTLTIGTKDNNGVSHVQIIFGTDGGINWVKNNYNFIIEDVTPKGYKNIFSKLGYSNGFTSTINYSHVDPNTNILDKETTYVIINITANPGTQAIKLYENSGKIINYRGSKKFYTYYVFPREDINSSTYYPFILQVYKQLRQKVESKLWTNNMSTLDKLRTMADYFDSTLHYPDTNCTKKEYNPELWDYWSVDDKLSKMGSNIGIIPRLGIYQGRIASCLAAEDLYVIATEDLGLAKITKNTTNQEGVYLGYGAESSTYNADSGHVTMYYVDKTGNTYVFDTQGQDYKAGKYKCSEHHCRENVVPLD